MKKAKKKTVGTNIRLSENGHKAIKTFCQDKGYKIAAFIEITVLKKIATETIESI